MNPTCSSAGTVVFLGVNGSTNATEASAARFVAPVAGTLNQLRAKVAANVPTAETVTVAVSVNASLTGSPTCTIAAAASACADTSTTKAIVAGDLVAISFKCAGGTTAVTQPVTVSVVLR